MFTLAVGLVLIVCAAVPAQLLALGAEGTERRYTIQFLGEDGKPVPNARFYLYERRNGEFNRALFRGHRLNAEATIELESMPAEFTIGVVSSESFYYWFCESPFMPRHVVTVWNMSHLIGSPGAVLRVPLVGMLLLATRDSIVIKPGQNVIQVEQSGTVSFTFAEVDPQIRNPLVVPCFRQFAIGGCSFYMPHGGIGIFLEAHNPFEFEGLRPGKYKFELKKEYESDDLYWSKGNVVVQKGKRTKLDGLKAALSDPTKE